MRSYQITMVILALVVVTIVTHFVLYNFPNSADEYAYLFQAKNLAQWQTFSPIHEPNALGENLQRYFYFVHIGETDGKYYGRFPFGYSLLLIPSVLIEQWLNINTYWVVNTLFAALTLLLLIQFGRRFFSERVGVLAGVMGLFSAWFILTSSSYFSHTTNAFFVGLFLYLFCLALDQSERKQALKLFSLAGFTFGFAVIVRFLDPLPYLLVLLVLWFMWQKKYRANFFYDVVFFGLGGGLWACWLFYYNYSLTGNMLQTAYEYYNPLDQSTRFIFMVVQDDGSIQYDFSRILEIGFNQRGWPNIKLLFDWHVWVWLLALLPVALLLKSPQSHFKPLLIAFVLCPVLVMFIYTIYGGPPANQYGPRYYYSCFVPVTLLAAVCLDRVVSHQKILVAIMGSLCLLASWQLLRHSIDFEKKVYERTNLFRTIEAAELSNAVVILKTGSGSMHQVDLPRNELDFSDDVLIVQESWGDYGPLIRHYPNKQYYEYRYQGEGKLGKLTPLHTSADGRFSYIKATFDPRQVLQNSSGLIGQYYLGKDFQQLVMQRLDAELNFDWGYEAPAERLPNDNFSIRWQGILNIAQAGEYTFEATNDDGVRVYINEQAIIENWYGHGALTEQATLQLDAGQHSIRVEYFDERYQASFRLLLEGPGLPKQALSKALLTPMLPNIEPAV